MSDTNIRHRLPQQVILLGWVSLLADVSSEMIYPLIPLFLTGILGAPAIVLGLIEGASQLLVSAMSAYSGVRSDKSGKRAPFIRWGYGLPVLGKALLAAATSWHLVLFGKAIDRFGKGLRGSPRDALIADSVRPEERGAAFGFHRMMDTAGALLGVLIAALFLSLLSGDALSYRIIFGAASFFALSSVAVAWFVKESDSGTPSAAALAGTAKNPKGVAPFGSRYWRTLVVLAFFGFANSSDTFLLLRASDVGLTPVQVVLAYALYNFGYSALSYYGGTLSDRVGRWKVILAGWTIYAVVYAGFAMTGAHGIWYLFGLYGVYMALTEGVSKALIVDCVPPERRGAALGVLYLALGLTAISSNVLSGYLWDSVSKAAPFYMGACFALLSVLGVLVSGLAKVERR